MGFRVNRRVKIAKGLSINVSKSGVSASAKVGRVTVNSRRGVTANVAKGVSVNVPMGKGGTRAKSAPATRRAAAVPAMPAGPRTFRRPFGRVPGWLYWTLGITVAVLLGAIPVAGGFIALFVIAGLIAVWQLTPKQVAADPSASAPAEVATPVEAPTAE